MSNPIAKQVFEEKLWAYLKANKNFDSHQSRLVFDRVNQLLKEVRAFES